MVLIRICDSVLAADEIIQCGVLMFLWMTRVVILCMIRFVGVSFLNVFECQFVL